MKTIAIDARIINSSTGRYVERLLYYLQQLDSPDKYVVLVRQKDASFWKPTNPNFSVQVADFDNYSFAEQIGFKNFLDELKPDLVHFCMPQQPVLYRGAKVTTFHDLTLLNTYNSDKNWFIFKAKQLVGRFVFKSVAKRSNFIITPTHFTKEELVKFSGVDSRKVIVTHEAAELTTTTQATYPVPLKRYLLYVGQQPDYKNIRRLAEAHQRLLKDFPDLGLVLAGKKAADTLANETYFESQKYRNIHFTGFVSDEQLQWLYANAEAFVFPSLMEGFGLPGLEAMTAGTPVISSSASCLPEVHGDAAVYFDPYNVDSIVTAIKRVLQSESLRESLRSAGYKRLTMFSWRRMAEQTRAIYTDVLK